MSDDDCSPYGIERPYIPLDVIGQDSNVATRSSDGAPADWIKLNRPVTDAEIEIMNGSPVFQYERVPDHDDELYVARKEIP